MVDRQATDTPTNIVFQLKPVPPFRLDLTVWALRRRPHNQMDRWDGQTYRRVLPVQDRPVEVAVTQIGPSEMPLLRVESANCPPHLECAAILATLLVKMLGLDVDLTPFYLLAAADDRFLRLAERFRGLKPPRFPSVFEALINAIACQQLSLTVGIHILNRLAAALGLALPGGGARHAFPRPADLAGAEPETLRSLGFSHSKAGAAIALARGLVDHPAALEDLKDLEDIAVLKRLTALKGVGRWSAEYALLRGLGRLYVFPGDDVGARKNLQAWLHLDEPLDYEGVHRHLAPWHPYAGFLYFHFLLNHLAEEGHIS